MNIVQPPSSVRGYLSELRRALKGAPRGLIADALADCEEHLNMEIAQNPEMDEAAVMTSVVDTYGSPQEIAEEYRDMESAISTPFPKQPESNVAGGGFFGVVSDPRTYGALLYMLLSLVTGIFYFTWTVVGIAFTASASVLIIGIPVALGFLMSFRLLSHMEGRIVEGLLGVRMPRRLPAATTDEKIWPQIKDALGDVRTWTSVLYFLLLLPLGIVYFTLGLLGLLVSLILSGFAISSLLSNHSYMQILASCFNHLQLADYPWLDHLCHTAPGLILLTVLGIAMFFLVLHMARFVGWTHGKIAEGLLVRL